MEYYDINALTYGTFFQKNNRIKAIIVYVQHTLNYRNKTSETLAVRCTLNIQHLDKDIFLTRDTTNEKINSFDKSSPFYHHVLFDIFHPALLAAIEDD